jgi:hypothetical protein
MGEKHAMEIEEIEDQQVKSHKVSLDLKNLSWRSDESALHMKLSFPEHLVVEALMDRGGVEEKTRVRELNIPVALLEDILNIVFSKKE